MTLNEAAFRRPEYRDRHIDHETNEALHLPGRLALAEKVAARYGADHILLYDDLTEALPEAQRSILHGLPGYERTLLPGLLWAPGFESGATVLVAAPPNPVELAAVRQLKAGLETTLGREVAFRIAFERDSEVIDLLTMGDTEYEQLCHEYALQVGAPEATPSSNANTLRAHFSTLAGQSSKTFVAPFQAIPEHYTSLEPLVETGSVALPDIPITDKAWNNFALKEGGVADVIDMLAITADGQVIDAFAHYQEARAQVMPVPKTDESIGTFSAAIVEGVDRVMANGSGAFAKLDASGVSGASNLLPDKFPWLYDSDIPQNERAARVAGILAAMPGDYLPESGIVEEFVDIAEHHGMPMDYTVGGVVVDGEFHLTSIVPFGTTDGIYDSLWVSSHPEALGEDPQTWAALAAAYQERARIMAAHGYANGILAGDVFMASDGRMLHHDFNDRRGGRSTPEALEALMPQGWLEAQVEVDLTDLGIWLSNAERFSAYTKVCKRLYEGGAYPFSTAFGYFGEEGNRQFMKFKVMMPHDKLRLPDSGHVPRAQQLALVKSSILATAIDTLGLETQSIGEAEIFTPDGVWPPYVTGRFISSEILPRYRADIENGIVVDVGTGSGLLAVTAARLGADTVLAADLNPGAMRAVAVNAQLNGFDERTITPALSDGLDGIPNDYQGRVGLIVANPPTQPFLLSDVTVDKALRDGDARAWNESDGNGRGVLDKIITQGVEFTKPGGKIVTSTTTRHGHATTTAMLDAMIADGRIQSWSEIHRERQPLASMYEQYVELWQKLAVEDGDQRIHEIDGSWYHDFIVLEIVR